jgi:hypothetical protein
MTVAKAIARSKFPTVGSKVNTISDQFAKLIVENRTKPIAIAPAAPSTPSASASNRIAVVTVRRDARNAGAIDPMTARANDAADDATCRCGRQWLLWERQAAHN